MGAAVWAKLKNHPKVIDRIKYTGRDSATPELVASLFGVQRVLVGDALYENDAGALADVWGKFVVVAYTEVGSMADMGRPTFGYTYQLGGYPVVEQAYQDRNAKSLGVPGDRRGRPGHRRRGGWLPDLRSRRLSLPLTAPAWGGFPRRRVPPFARTPGFFTRIIMANPKKPAVKNDPAAAVPVVVEAVEPIRHDGIDVAPGEQVSVTPDAAAALIAAGAAMAVE